MATLLAKVSSSRFLDVFVDLTTCIYLGSYDARKGGGSTPEVDKALKQNNLDKTTDKGFDTGDKKVGGDEKIKARSPESHVDHYLAKPTAEAFTKREDSTDVDDYLRKYNLPKTTDEAFGRGDDRRSIKGDPVASDDSTLPETAREGTQILSPRVFLPLILTHICRYQQRWNVLSSWTQVCPQAEQPPSYHRRR